MIFIAATVNTFLAAVLLLRDENRGLRMRQALVLTPVLGAGAGLMQTYWHLSLTHLVILLWVPVIEEVVFRLGLGTLLRSHCSRYFIACYGTALVFALLHGLSVMPWEITRIINLGVGPFILSIVSDVLYRQWGSLSLSIILHACCNFIQVYQG